jgi:hypothetical protein
MRLRLECLKLSLSGLLLLGDALAHGAELSNSGLEQGFVHPPPEARLRLFWRVFGPAWKNDEIDYQLRLIREAGVGGVTAFFMYPVALDSSTVHNQRFLSAEFLDSLNHAAHQARLLGLQFSVAGGTGWPFGGPSVSLQDAAKQLRQITVPLPPDGGRVRLPPLREGEGWLAAFSGTNDVTRRITSDRMSFQATGLHGSVLLYSVGPTFMKVKRPAFGAEGLVLDHFQSTATEHYLAAVVEPMLRAAPGLVDSVFCDSLEVYGANWTGDFAAVFARQRSYPLLPKLPVLFDTSSPAGAEVRFDFWRTLCELTESRFTRFTSDWAHHHGVKFEMEAYGTPPNPLTAARFLDIPTGEQYEWKGFSLSRLASSGAHLAGKRVIGAEAWTWLGIPNRLGDTLSDLKLASDLHFLAGENDLVGVDFAYSPRQAGTPGWLPYYGPVLNQNNPQWPWFRELANYASRCQWLLRQGRSVAQVAVYLPVEDAFAAGPVDQMLLDFKVRDHFVTGEKTGEFGLQAALRHESTLLHGLQMAGFNYDGIDFFSLDRLAEVSKGQLLAGEGVYQTLILPHLEGIEIRALRRIVSFCQSGGTVLITGALPRRTYGGRGANAPARSAALFRQLLGESPVPNEAWARRCGHGRVMFAPNEGEALTKALRELRPDLRLNPVQLDAGFVHRQSRSRDVYFLANVGDQSRQFRADFSVGLALAKSRACAAEFWDPMTGERRELASEPTADGFIRTEITLPPRGSAFVIFRPHPTAPLLAEPRTETEPLQATWEIGFQGSNAPPSASLPELVSWTTLPEARFFSGQATYSATFNWNRPLPKQAWLVFSQVHTVAEVRINGQLAGPAWNPPFEVEVTKGLKAGTNSLAITVANLPINRFLGTPDQDLKSLRAAYGNRFPDPEEKRVVREPAPSGLIGPVSLRYSKDQ